MAGTPSQRMPGVSTRGGAGAAESAPTVRQVGNVVGANAFRESTDAATFAAFDALPLTVRRALAEGVNFFCPVTVLEDFEALAASVGSIRATAQVLAKIKRSEGAEMGWFAVAYEKAHGRPYPHLAADATILRYDEAQRVRGRR